MGSSASGSAPSTLAPAALPADGSQAWRADRPAHTAEQVTTRAAVHPAPDSVETTGGLAATLPGKLRLPPSITLFYDVKGTRKGISFPASSTLRFSQDGSTYDARLDIKALLVGTRTQTSKGSVDASTGLQPVRFGDKTKSELATHFDRSRTPPALRFSGNTPDMPLQTFTQDRLSVLFQLAAMLAGEPARFGAGSTVVVHTAGPRDADFWQFKVAQPEALSLPVGTMTAIHLIRTPLHVHDNQVDIWLAPSLGYAPVRVLWTQSNGDTVDQRLSSHEP